MHDIKAPGFRTKNPESLQLEFVENEPRRRLLRLVTFASCQGQEATGHVVSGQRQGPAFPESAVMRLHWVEEKPDRQARPLQKVGPELAQCQRAGISAGTRINPSGEEPAEIEGIGMES
ncbi:hypothetical protein D3C73_847100 [compost metagenome]